MNAWPTRLTSGTPPARLDRLGHGPARAHVVDDLRAGLLREHRLGEQRGDEVARDELAGVVDEEAAVGVAVERDPEVGLLLGASCATMNSRFSGSSGFGSWCGKVPSGSKLQRIASIGRRSSTGCEHRAAHPVRRVDHDAQRPDRGDVDEREHALEERGPDVVRLDVSRRDGSRCLTPGHGSIAHVQKSRLAADRQRAAADDLHPDVLLGIVRGGDLDPAVEPELADGEIEHLRPDHAEVEHVRAGRDGALDHRFGHGRRRHAHVAADRDPARLELLDVGAPDRVGALLVELRGVQPAHVVRLEDLGVEHGA